MATATKTARTRAARGKTAAKPAAKTKTTTKAKPAAAKRTAPAAKTARKAAPRRKKQTLVIDRAADGKFVGGGLRDQFVYRHFGIEEATGRDYAAHVIRAAGGKPPIRHHTHPDCAFLLVYVLKGWVKFWYEGRGEEKLVAGDVHMLPPGIKHAVTGWSRNLEMLEVTHPADYQSIELTDRQIARLG